MDSRMDAVTGKERAVAVARWAFFVPAAAAVAYLCAVFLTFVTPASTETLFGRLNVAWQGAVSAGIFVLIGALVAPAARNTVAVVLASVISALALLSMLSMWASDRLTAAFAMAAVGIVVGAVATAVIVNRN